METLDEILIRLRNLILDERFEPVETDTLELKAGPADGGLWKEVYKTANAFLNTRGGILILGIKEEGKGAAKRYVFTGWKESFEGPLKDLPKQFTDRGGSPLDLHESFPSASPRNFMNGQIGVVYVDELAADRKYVFYEGEARRRIATGDHKVSVADISAQEEYREEARNARELVVVPNSTIDQLDLDKLNDYITRLNQPVRVETLKPTLQDAQSFLERKSFLKDGAVTMLGMLVCGTYPGDRLGFRSHVHGYVILPGRVTQDKQDFIDNILPLMDLSYNYILRNILVGISMDRGGSAKPQYPEELLRETVNNALAHRDYSINKQASIAIRPDLDISIRNPGSFRSHLLIEAVDQPPRLRRIIPEAKPRNPKLADVLRVYRKWEGRGIGMATMVNLCLENRIDLPYYILRPEEVELVLRSGKLLDERMERLFVSFDRYLDEKLHGIPLSLPQKLILAYLIKSEWDNQLVRYTILLSPDNNHYEELKTLETAGLISTHPLSSAVCEIYIVDRNLVSQDYLPTLRDLFGLGFDSLSLVAKQALGVVHRFNQFSKQSYPSAKQVSFTLWYEESHNHVDAIKEFDAFLRKLRSVFERLVKEEFVIKQGRGYVLNHRFKDTHLF